MLAVLDAQALVLPADEDGRDEIAADEEEQEYIVQFWVAVRVEDAEADEAHGADNGKENGQDHEHLLQDGRVGHQATLVP